MCTNLSTKQGQAWIPDFLKDTSGTGPAMNIGVRKNNSDVEKPLMPSDYDEFAIERRREALRRQYDEKPNAGSIQPIHGLSKKDMMEELT